MENDDGRPYEWHLLANVRDTRPEQHVGRLVREHRLGLGWSQQQLADKMTRGGFPMIQSQIQKLEQARRPIRIDEIWALAMILETRVIDLLGFDFLPNEIDVQVETAKARLRGAHDELETQSKSIDKRKSEILAALDGLQT